MSPSEDERARLKRYALASRANIDFALDMLASRKIEEAGLLLALAREELVIALQVYNAVEARAEGRPTRLPPP
jgi:hypothetical protein